MAGLGLVGVTDVARSFGENIHEATVESISRWLQREWLGKVGGGFNYNPALYAAVRLMKGEWTEEQAIAHVRSRGPSFGWASNEAVLVALLPYISAHSGPVYEVPHAAAIIGKTDGRSIHVGVKAPIVRVQDGLARVVYPAFRKTYLPTEQQAVLECSIVREITAQNDFYGAELEYVAARSTGRGLERFCVIKSSTELALLSKEVVDGLLSKYVAAVNLLWAQGIGLQRPRLGTYRVIDPDQADLF